jgi:hypothetical protein
MVKASKVDKFKSDLKDAKLEIKNLKAELKKSKVEHKKELKSSVSAAYDSAVHAAFDEFQQREIAREAVIEKAVNQALVEFEKNVDKKEKKLGGKVKSTKAVKSEKKSTSKKKA